MKAVLQRVSHASVTIDGETISEIGPGLVVLLGVASTDTPLDAQWLAGKTAEIRIFPDDSGKFNLSVQDVEGSVLAVSQFTLLASTKKGRRPDFIDAARPEPAMELFNMYVQELCNLALNVKTGRFQTHMQVEIHNDGPVTIILDSREKFPLTGVGKTIDKRGL